MRLCVPIPCFFGNVPFEDAVKKVAALGFDAVETYDWRPLDLDRARAVCAENGVEFISMCTTDFRLTDSACRSDWLAGLSESCAAAVKAGVKRLITQSGPDTGAPRAEQRANIVETLRLARPILEDRGVTLMIEPLNTIFDHRDCYLWSSSEAFGIVNEADCEFIKVVFDIYHQQISEGNVIPNVTGNLDKIAHLHSAGHPGRHELQYGENDYKNIFAAIDKAGYKGSCGLEYGPLLPAEESLLEAKRIYG